MTAKRPTGRDGEVAWLLERVRQPRGLGLSVTLVSGPAGVGRSHVLASVAEGHDGPVCRAVALPWERSRPGALLHQLSGTGDVDPDPLVAAADLCDSLSAGIPPEEVRLVVVDDAHLADDTSIEVLLSLRRHHPDAPVRVLLGSPSTSPATVRLARLSDARLDLSPLEAGDLARVAAGLGVSLSPSAARRLRRHTGGLPAAAVALLTELETTRWSSADELPAPAGVRDDVASRLERLDPRARRLVEAVAVLGPELTPTLAAEAAELSPDETWSVLDQAVDAGLLAVSGTAAARRLSPVDHLVAAAVRHCVGLAASRAMHLRAAAAASPAEALPHRVAAAVGPDAALADDLDREAVAVASEGAWARAAELLVDASRLSPEQRLRESRLTRAVDALVGAGDVDGALALLPDVEGLRETPLRDAVLGYVAILRGRGGEARSQLDRAWAIVNADRDPDTAALVCQRFVLHALCSGAWSELVSWADRALTLVGPDHPAAVESAVIRGLGLVASGDVGGARTAYEGLTDRALPAAQAQRASLGRGWLHLAADEVSSARAELERALPQRRDGGSTRISLWAAGWLARAHFVAGEWDDALRVASQGRDLADRSGIVLTGPLLDWTTVQVHVMRGEDDLALAALRTAEAATQDYATMRVPTLLARAAWAEAHADHEGVVAALLPLTAPDLAEAVAEPGFWPWVDLLVVALVALQRLDDAEAVLGPHETRVRDLGHRSGSARLGRARGRLAAARGDLDAARRSFDAALAALVGLGLRVERAHTLLAYGQVLRRAGKRAEADVLLTSARDDYAAIGATACVERCDRELKAGGVRLARGEAGSTDLTPQEQAVAGLVAQGRSNREVADVLFVSPKTVQFHLTRIYAKLGVRSRTELASRWERDD